MPLDWFMAINFPNYFDCSLIFVYYALYDSSAIIIYPSVQMRNNIDKNRSWTSAMNRNYSPNSFANRNNFAGSSVSVHSDHLWNLMEEVELFPEEIHQLFRYEERNLANYKKAIEREKARVVLQVEHLKKEVAHNIDDLKISILAELDRIYKGYMERYATLKSEVVQIKKMKEEIQMDLNRRATTIPSYSPKKDTSEYSKPSLTSNANIMRSLEKNNFEVRKYQMLNYIAQLQREKIIPLGEVTRQLVVLTQYENGYFQNNEFQRITADFIGTIKEAIRGVYDSKYQFIRQPEQITRKDEEPILKQVYEEPLFNNNPHNLYADRRQPPPAVSKLEDFKVARVSPEAQSMGVEWGETLALEPLHALKSLGEDIVLCCLEVTRNVMAVGSKNGQINVYEISSGQRLANLRGHKASICRLALIHHGGKKFLASGSDHGCSSIVLWDTSSWNMRMRIQGHRAAVTAIVDLQDGRDLVSGSYDKTINIYSMASEGKLAYSLPANKTSVTALLLNSNASKMISCGLDDTLSVWQLIRGSAGVVETMFLERIIQNNTMICSLVASAIRPDIVLLGAKDGKVKVIDIDRGQAGKSLSVCSNAVIQMVVLERSTKPQLPIIVCWPCGEECIKIVNTESGKVDSIHAKGVIEFGCGIGPKASFLSGGKNLAVLSQSKEQPQVNFFRLDVN